MTTGYGDAEDRPDETRGAHGGPRSSVAPQEELRAQFQTQGQPELAESRQRDVRKARGAYAAFAGLVAVVCLVLGVVRLGQGDALGVWVGTYAMGFVLGGWGFVLARIGHTRWAMMVACIGAALAGLGDSPAFR
ncbi:hypothetical protein [Streptomyces sp. NPDC098781]|uniref:hypothetical protein n=1 Tax=Streptomyces sp. NPDC098781 TaxID=3366097 RepID=UPI00382244FB